jgi:acetylglutamate kinase
VQILNLLLFCYIHLKTLSVIKIGGNVIDDPVKLAQFLPIFAALPSPKILIHGGGKVASQLSEKMGIEVKMHQGRRITDRPTLDIAVMVYAGLVNKGIVAQLQAVNCSAAGLCGADMNLIRARKRPVKDIDYGYVGDVEAVNTQALAQLLESGLVPILAPITHDGQGTLLNTNADTIASVIAVAMAKMYRTELVFCFEKKGVLLDANDENSLISQLNPTEYARLKAEGAIYGGMIPKLDNAFAAIAQGVSRVVIAEAVNLSGLKAEKLVGTVISA